MHRAEDYIQQLRLLFNDSGKTIVLKRHQLLQNPGVVDQNLYLIQEGAVRVYIMLGEVEQNIRFGYTGNVLVLLDSFLSDKPTGFFVQAIRKTKVSCLSPAAFKAHLQSSLNTRWWQHILEDLVLQQMNREVDLLIESPMERYSRVLARSPQLFQEIPNKHIANYLRMSPETFSRLKSVELNQDF